MDQSSNNRTIPNLVRTFAPEGNIHNLPCYHEGELWHSYLNRVAIENGIPDAKRLLELCSCLGPTNWTANQRLNYECMKEASRGILKETGDDWILTGTLFKGMSPLSSRLAATRRLYHYNLHSRLVDRLTGSMPAYIQGIKICPECRKGEGEDWFFHTDLQMPDVTICPVHGCSLMKYSGPPYMEHIIDEFTEIIPMKGDEQLSVFEMEFFNHGFQCDKSTVKRAITERLNEIGQPLSGNGSIPGQDDFERIIPNSIFLSILRNRKMPISSTLLLMCILFKDVQTLSSYILSESKIQEKFFASAESCYSLVSPYRDDFIIVRCEQCGTVFPTTPSGIITGWGCPRCIENEDHTQMFSDIVSNSTANRSLLISPFKNWTTPVKILDRDTNEQKQLVPQRLKEPLMTETGKDHSYEDEVKTKGNFTLLGTSINRGQVRFTLRHDVCGNEFSVYRTNFLISPVCRKCKARKTAEETFLASLHALSSNFHMEGPYDGDNVCVTDGKVTFTGKQRTVLGKVKRHLNPQKKKNREKEYVKIGEIVTTFKGRMFSTKDILNFYGEIDQPRVITNYISRLGRKGKLRNVAPGIWCHSEETYSTMDILMFQYVKDGARGCPIGLTAIRYLGKANEYGESGYTIAINYVGKTDNHVNEKMFGASKVTLFRLREYVTTDNLPLMMFVASVWHEETIPEDQRENVLDRLLDNALEKGFTNEQAIELGDRFPRDTARMVRQIIYRRTYGKGSK